MEDQPTDDEDELGEGYEVFLAKSFGVGLLTLGLVGRHSQKMRLRGPTTVIVKVRCNQYNTLNYESSGRYKKRG